MKKVLLVGNFGSRNVGDEIILWTALQKYPEAVVMTADKVFSQRFINNESNKNIFIPPFPTGIRSLVKFIFSKKSRCAPQGGGEIYKNIEVEKIIFPGGGLLAIKMRAYFIWGITLWWLRRYFPKAEIIFEHQGVDQTDCWLKKMIIRYFFKNSNKISVRDEISRDFLQILNITSENTGDCVEIFLKNSPLIKGSRGDLLNKNLGKNLVLINACQENSAKFTELCTPENLPQGTAAAFICFDTNDAKYVPEGFKGQIIFPENVDETFKLFKRAKMAIGQRLHFLILANHFCSAENTFTLGQPYAQKVENLAGKYGIKSLV